MNWSDVGQWVRDNAGTGASLVGSLLLGNVQGAVAAGVSLVSSATGTNDPARALQALQSDPATVVRLRELTNENEASIRQHIEAMARVDLGIHSETQQTIRAGDAATDKLVRETRPTMARQSWQATVAYCLGCWVLSAFGMPDLFDVYVAGMLSTPAWLYIGARTGDKFAAARSGNNKGA